MQNDFLTSYGFEVDHGLQISAKTRELADNAAAELRMPNALAFDEARRLLRIAVVDHRARGRIRHVRRPLAARRTAAPAVVVLPANADQCRRLLGIDQARRNRVHEAGRNATQNFASTAPRPR